MIVEHKEYDLGQYRKITAYYDEYGLTGISREAFEKIIIPALRKQDPMIPVQCDLEDGSRLFCQACGGEISAGSFGLAYCSRCGQKIDWMGEAK